MTASVRTAIALAAAAVAGTACAPPPAPSPPGVLEPTPASGEVATALLVLGDPGYARAGRTPVLEAMRAEAERWSGAQVPVKAIYLGDLVYPEGVRPPWDPGHAQDTLALNAQLQVVRGLPGAEAVLIPGNHDWGDRIGDAGRARLAGTRALVTRWQEAGLPARLAPEDGIGPVQEMPTPNHTLVYLDTQDWLQADAGRRAAASGALASAVADAPGHVLVFAHHPLRSGSSHGAEPPVTGPRSLLSRAGVVAQDLTSSLYQGMAREIAEALKAGGDVLLYAAGHDHNLQLFRDPSQRRWELVVGSGSKLSELWDAPHMVLGSAEPAFARVLLLEDGGVHLTLYSGGNHPGVCPAGSDAAACVEAGTAAFRAVDARWLAPAGSGRADPGFPAFEPVRAPH